MNKSLLGSLGLLGVVLVAGCGSDESSGAPGGGGGDCASLAAAQCQLYARCMPSSMGMLGLSTANCVERLTLGCQDWLKNPGTTVGSMGSCLSNAVQASTCEEAAALSMTCTPSVGTLENGSACGQGAQCKSGGCKPTSLNGCGVCMATVGEGESCADAPCDPDLSCGMSGVCSSSSVKDPAKGEPCPANGCGSWLRCVEGVCTDLVGEGGACTDWRDCAMPFTCKSGMCAQEDVTAEGEPCEVGTLCEDGTSCATPAGASSICIKILREGESCEGTSGAKCEAYSGCANGVCTRNANSSQCK